MSNVKDGNKTIVENNQKQSEDKNEGTGDIHASEDTALIHFPIKEYYDYHPVDNRWNGKDLKPPQVCYPFTRWFGIPKTYTIESDNQNAIQAYYPLAGWPDILETHQAVMLHVQPSCPVIHSQDPYPLPYCLKYGIYHTDIRYWMNLYPPEDQDETNEIEKNIYDTYQKQKGDREISQSEEAINEYDEANNEINTNNDDNNKSEETTKIYGLSRQDFNKLLENNGTNFVLGDFTFHQLYSHRFYTINKYLIPLDGLVALFYDQHFKPPDSEYLNITYRATQYVHKNKIHGVSIRNLSYLEYSWRLLDKQGYCPNFLNSKSLLGENFLFKYYEYLLSEEEKERAEEIDDLANISIIVACFVLLVGGSFIDFNPKIKSKVSNVAKIMYFFSPLLNYFAPISLYTTTHLALGFSIAHWDTVVIKEESLKHAIRDFASSAIGTTVVGAGFKAVTKLDCGALLELSKFDSYKSGIFKTVLNKPVGLILKAVKDWDSTQRLFDWVKNTSMGTKISDLFSNIIQASNTKFFIGFTLVNVAFYPLDLAVETALGVGCTMLLLRANYHSSPTEFSDNMLDTSASVLNGMMLKQQMLPKFSDILCALFKSVGNPLTKGAIKNSLHTCLKIKDYGKVHEKIVGFSKASQQKLTQAQSKFLDIT